VRLLLGPLSYAPGLPGGLFAPLLVVGAAFGALFGLAAETAVRGCQDFCVTRAG
jgi:CIC family chloride channel protein